jgi:dTDP-4-amino-4,6-dideoxygalactose transaminase
MILRCNLSKQYKRFEKQILNAVTRICESGHYILGEEVERFEDEFAAYCGSKFAVGVASGTEALYLALRALDIIGPDDEVITSPFTPVPTASAIVMAGARPVFIDVNENDFLLNIGQLEDVISKKTKAIMPVHLFGNVAEMDKIMQIAQKYSLFVVEDACQAHGSVYKGKKAGSRGDIGCFSFYPTKNLGAYGDGGMVVTDNPQLAEKLKLLRDYGRDGLFTTKMLGINSRLDEIQAAILRIKLQFLDEMNNQRKNLAKIYFERLKGILIEFPIVAEGVETNYHVFVVRCKQLRNELRSYLEKSEIQTNIYYPVSMHLQVAFKYLGYKKGDFLMSEKAHDEVLALPMYSELDPAVVEMVCDRIVEFYEHS